MPWARRARSIQRFWSLWRHCCLAGPTYENLSRTVRSGRRAGPAGGGSLFARSDEGLQLRPPRRARHEPAHFGLGDASRIPGGNLIERQRFEGDARGSEAVLTEKGRALVPIIESMRAYGTEWLGAKGSCSEAPEPVVVAA